MTAFVLILAVFQAAALFWTALQLSNVFARAQRLAPLLFAFGALALALTAGRLGATDDVHRILCGPGDCLVIVLSVAGIRLVLVNKENDRLAREAHLEALAAAEAAAAARKAEAEAYVRAAAASLEARKAREAAGPGATRARPRPTP